MAALQNLAFGAAFGAVIRPAAGGLADVWQSRVGGNDIPDARDVTSRLNTETQHAALRQAADDLINGTPVSASEVVVRAAAENPELAKRIMVSAALKRDGPEFDDIVRRQEHWVEKLKAAADRRVKKDEALADAEYTKKLRGEAGVKPRTTHRIAARIIAEYERNILGAERVHADLQQEQSFLDEMIGSFDEKQLSPEALGELHQERATINAELAKETADIDAYAACLFGETS